MVRATRRRRAAPLRGRRARPDDRPALPRGRVSRASGLPVKAGLGRDRARARPSGGGPGRAPWLGRSADTRAGAWGGWRHGDLDGRVRRGRALAAPRLGGRRATRRPRRRGASARGDGRCCTPVAGSISRRSRHSRRRAQAQSLLTGVHALAPRIAGWLAATQARLGMPDEARATLSGFSAATRATRCPRCHRQRACGDLHGRGGPRRGVGCAPRRSGRHATRRPRVHARRSASARRHRAPLPGRSQTPPPPRPRRRSRPPSRTG